MRRIEPGDAADHGAEDAGVEQVAGSDRRDVAVEHNKVGVRPRAPLPVPLGCHRASVSA